MITEVHIKERPILFSGPMVRAILEGRKTQTRRVVVPTMTTPRVAPLHMEPWIIDGEQETDEHGLPCWAGYHPDYPGEAKWFSCPYGQPGDRLWVRETWNKQMIDGAERVAYRADIPNGHSFLYWHPSIHMPRWASRITLELTGVRVERVQDITSEDARAEGVDAPDVLPRSKFATLWDSINAKRGYGWETNCWVWVLEFKRL